MKDPNKRTRQRRIRRHIHIQKKIRGTLERPRIAVYRSLQQIYAQLVDDLTGKVLTAVSSLSKPVQTERQQQKLNKTQVGGKVGELLAAQAKEKGIQRVVFDRSGYLYHGRVKALAEGARKGGLQF